MPTEQPNPRKAALRPRKGWITPRQFSKEDFFCLHTTRRFKSASLPVLVLPIDPASVAALEADIELAIDYALFCDRTAGKKVHSAEEVTAHIFKNLRIPQPRKASKCQ